MGHIEDEAMKRLHTLFRAMLCFLPLFLAPSALARGDQRHGVNFGTTLTMSTETHSEGRADGREQQTAEVFAVSPHVGYAFSGLFNLGLRGSSEQITITEKTTPADGGPSTTSERDLNLAGAALYARLLFARYLFLDVAGGVYRGSSTKKLSSESTSSGSFSGSQDSESTSGTGAGLEAGAGIEIPLGLGLFFECAYAYRSLMLKDLADRDGGSIANDKSEFRFGLTSYLQ